MAYQTNKPAPRLSKAEGQDHRLPARFYFLTCVVVVSVWVVVELAGGVVVVVAVPVPSGVVTVVELLESGGVVVVLVVDVWVVLVAEVPLELLPELELFPLPLAGVVVCGASTFVSVQPARPIKLNTTAALIKFNCFCIVVSL
jgi:hypothetical protein